MSGMSVSSRSRTQPQNRRQSYNAAMMGPIIPVEKEKEKVPIKGSPSPQFSVGGPESPARPRQDVSAFVAATENCISTYVHIASCAELCKARHDTVYGVESIISVVGLMLAAVEPACFRLIDENSKEVSCYVYEHLSGVQVEGSGLALIIYKPDTAAYAYFFTSESTAPIAAALEQQRRKRAPGERVSITSPVWLRFANDSVAGKRVADIVTLPAEGPLTFHEANVAIETLPIKSLAILRTNNSIEVFSFERHTLWSIAAVNSDDLSQLFSALIQILDPPIVTALGEKNATSVDVLLALHAAVLKTATISAVSRSVRVPAVLHSATSHDNGIRPASVAVEKPLRLENRSQSYAPAYISKRPSREKRPALEDDKANRKRIVTDLVPVAGSPLRKPTKQLVRLICQRHGFNFVGALFRAVAPSSAEAERIVRGVVVLHSSLNKGGDLAAHFARQEIESLRPDDYAQLFRANTMQTRALIMYCRRQGSTFFQRALQPALAQLLDFAKPVEIDPSRDPKLNVQKNAANLRTLVQQFIDGLLGATDSMPSSVSSVMAVIREEVEKRFPGKGPHAVGCLLFLRLVCPIIIAPEQFGLAPAAKITAAARRSLILCSKVIQAMLSEVQGQMGAKEAYMAPLDSWIGERRGVVYSYAVALSRLPETRRLQGRAAVAEGAPSKEDLVGSFIGLQSVLLMPPIESAVVKQLSAHPKDSSRFTRSNRATAAAQGTKQL